MNPATTGERICTRCGERIPPGTLGGNCPRCLVALALGAKTPAAIGFPAGTKARPSTRFFGDFEIIEEIGRGGMGVVYKARQVSLNRQVALKMVAGAQLASPAQIQRFRLEAEAAARLDHPNIVPIYEIGEYEGQHFYSMKLIAGLSLAQCMRELASAPDGFGVAASLVAQLARAIHYAHQHGVLHRDLKPANILLDDRRLPHITDFGLAKLVEDNTSMTQSIAVLGTPAYMAPEVASGKSAQATVAADIYSLGAVLYELLAGCPPFSAENIPALLRAIVEQAPVPPGAVHPDRDVPRDLEIICLKCLEKETHKRYASAEALADDLERWLHREPILARPAGFVEKLWAWCRRKPAQAGLAGALGLLVLVIAGGSLVAVHNIEMARRSERGERKIAEQANRDLSRANQELGASVDRLELQLAEDLFTSGDVSGGLASLASLVRRDPSNRIATARLVSALAKRSYPARSQPAIRFFGRVRHVEWSPDGRRLLAVRQHATGSDTSAQWWDADTQAPVAGARDGVLCAHFSPNGAFVAIGCADRTAWILDAQNGQPLGGPLTHGAPVQLVRFSPDGSSLLTVSDGVSVRLWKVPGGEKLFEQRLHTGRTTDANFSPDGRALVTGSDLGSVRIWNITDFHETGAAIRLQTNIVSVQFSPDATLILTVSGDYAARLWDRQTGAAVGPPMQHAAAIEAACFSPDGRRIATASIDRTARLWDGHSAVACGLPLQHRDALTDARFSRDGRLLITGCWDNVALLWDVETGQQACGPLRHVERVWSVDFSPDATHAVSGSADGTLQVWDIRSHADRELVLRASAALACAACDGAGRLIATGADDGVAQVWSAATGRAVTPPLHHDRALRSVEFSPDGGRLLSASEDHRACIWDATNGNLLATLRHNGLISVAHFDSSGQRVVTASRDGTARVWNARTGEPVTPPLSHSGHWVREAIFSPDGAQVATCSHDRTAVIWDARSGRRLSPVLPHIDYALDLAFSPDGTLLATASNDNTAHIWDARNGESLGRPIHHTRTVCQIAFSHDGRHIVTASWDRTARVWDARTGAAVTEPMAHEDRVSTAHFSPDDTRIVTASADGTAWIWDAKTGRPISEPLRSGGAVVMADFTPDGEHIFTASKDGTARLWNTPAVPLPAPPWLAQLAESTGGLRLDAQRDYVFAGASFNAFTNDSATNNLYGRLRLRFLPGGDAAR